MKGAEGRSNTEAWMTVRLSAPLAPVHLWQGWPVSDKDLQVGKPRHTLCQEEELRLKKEVGS